MSKPKAEKATIQLEIEGCDANGQVQLGDPASLIIEGLLPARHQPEDCYIQMTVTTSQQTEEEEGQFSLGLDEFLDESGPYLCQIDFEAEQVGQMMFTAELMTGDSVLAMAQAEVRIINPLRDASGKPRKGGAGALKVKK